MAVLVYRCPHCGASHEIDEALIGDRVTCRQCGKPFQAAAPVAKPVEVSPGEKASFRVAAGQGEVEDTILTAHPAIFRKHPLGALIAWALILAGAAGVILGAIGQAIIPGVGAGALVVAGMVTAGIGLAIWLVWWARSRFTSLTVTNRRTILRRGLFARETTEVLHRDVRNIQVNQTTMGRLLGVGDLALSSSGQDELEITVQGVPNPSRIADVIRDMQ